jgi:hypothetical protein
MNKSDGRCAAIMGTQRGLIARPQAMDAGMTPKMIRHRVDSGTWIAIFSGVYALAGIELSQDVLMLACQLAEPRAVASHRSAAAKWGFAGFEDDIIEITITSGSHRRLPGVVTHYRESLDTQDIRTRGGIRVTSVERTLIDLGAVVSPKRVEEALESALFKRVTTQQRLADRLSVLRGPGRRGCAALGRLLAERDPEQAAAESIFDTRFYRLLKNSRWINGADFQHQVYDSRGHVGRLDVAYQAALVGVEPRGLAHHSGRDRVRLDTIRHNRLTALGWRMLYPLWEDLDRKPRVILGALADMLDERLFHRDAL